MTTAPAPPLHPPHQGHFQPSPPAALAGVLNPAISPTAAIKGEQQRDSAYFSSASTNGELSKHTSLATQNSTYNLAPSQYQYPSSDNMTPSPITGNGNGGSSGNGHPLPSPTTSSGMPLTTMVSSPMSPTSDTSVDASMLAKLNPPHHESRYTLTAPSSTRASIISVADSRRDSVDGRMQQDFSGMRLAANSPYTSANQSTTSIQSSLQQQRNPGHISVVSSAGERLSGRGFPSFAHRYGPSRTAPVITGPVGGPIANAEEPTKGQPWAFPDEASEPRGDGASSYMESRRSSIADSFASSQFTESSRLPPGQHRMEEAYPSDARLSRASSEYVVVKNGIKEAAQGQGMQQHHHHHTLQTRVSQIQDEEGTSPGSGSTGQPYSRTPELRKSHKMAERKRRNEMKELYDELKSLLPSERGNKTSKWEVLSKSIHQHKQQEERYKQLEHFHRMVQETVRDKDAQIAHQRKELAEMREEMRLMKNQLYGSQGGAPPPTQSVSSYPHASYREEGYGHSALNNGARRESVQQRLPPLPAISQIEPSRSSLNHLNTAGLTDRSFMTSGGPDAMAGVQYERNYASNYART